jgi:hypothetical protein
VFGFIDQHDRDVVAYGVPESAGQAHDQLSLRLLSQLDLAVAAGTHQEIHEFLVYRHACLLFSAFISGVW